jgi:hypothetical protein
VEDAKREASQGLAARSPKARSLEHRTGARKGAYSCPIFIKGTGIHDEDQTQTVTTEDECESRKCELRWYATTARPAL